MRHIPPENLSKIFVPNIAADYPPTDPRLIDLVSVTAQLITTASLIGVQPMDGPTGVAELLRFNWAKSNEASISIESRSQEVVAVSRLIDSVAELEAIQDFMAFAPNQESLIIHKMAQTIANHIDDEHLRAIAAVASEHVAPLQGNIVAEIHALSLDIARNTRRGVGNYVIISTQLLPSLKDSPNFALIQNPDINKLLSYVGNIYHNLEVYVKRDDGSTTEDILIGYQGQRDEDAGLVWCPYQLKVGPIALDCHTLQPKLGCVYRAAYATDSDSHLYYIKATVQKPG
jgi:hypothetical protein